MARLPDQEETLGAALISAEGHLSDRRAYRIEMRLEACPAQAGARRSFYGGEGGAGSVGFTPDVCIRSLKLVIDGQEVSLPVEAYADLGDPYWSVPSLSRRERDLILRISGGNAGWTDYTAEIVIRRNKASERRVTNHQLSTTDESYRPEIKIFK